MKKIVLAFCTVVVFILGSCSKDNDDATNYLDNKLIEGTWIGKLADDSIVYIFMNNEATYKYYARISHLDTLKLDLQLDLGSYLITDSSIFFSIRHDRNCNYKFGKERKDSLYIKNSSYWVNLKKL